MIAEHTKCKYYNIYENKMVFDLMLSLPYIFSLQDDKNLWEKNNLITQQLPMAAFVVYYSHL